MSRINIFQRIRDECEISRIYQIIICANRRKCPLPVRECEADTAVRWSHGASCSCSSVCKTLARLLAGAGAGAGCGLTPQLRKVASRTLSPLPARARPPAASSSAVSQQKPATVSLPASSHRTTLDKCTFVHTENKRYETHLFAGCRLLNTMHQSHQDTVSESQPRARRRVARCRSQGGK